MWGYKHRDPAIRSRARDQAAWLIRDHGDEAEAVLRAKMSRPNLSQDDLYRFKLTLEELHDQIARKSRRRSRRPQGLLARILTTLGPRRRS